MIADPLHPSQRRRVAPRALVLLSGITHLILLHGWSVRTPSGSTSILGPGSRSCGAAVRHTPVLRLNRVRERAGSILVIFTEWAHMLGHLNGVN
ncbi:hypothetical protein PVAP13_2NG402603 [Panicum virgatum]|uniref:Uncharacterized protein n=1 Tax=Panicum virgatum TaxID=38727 RepID=A0A8T0VPS6_PANVG|nr:hypothetical protein PVAP13_2NG402603 [Panicum virgatum]